MMFKQQVKIQRRLLIIKSLTLFLLIVLGGGVFIFMNQVVNNNEIRLTNLEELETYINTQHNKLLLREGFLNNADAIYSTMAIKRDLSVENYVSELKTVIAATMSYYNSLSPVSVEVSYSNVPLNKAGVVPLHIVLNMNNVFDYAPVRLFFVLFNNLSGSVLCREAYIAKIFQDNLYEKFNSAKYLFSSKMVLDWFVLLKSPRSSYSKSFTVEYKPTNKQTIETIYNMSTWNESFMLFPHDIENLKVLHHESVKKIN